MTLCYNNGTEDSPNWIHIGDISSTSGTALTTEALASGYSLDADTGKVLFTSGNETIVIEDGDLSVHITPTSTTYGGTLPQFTYQIWDNDAKVNMQSNVAEVSVEVASHFTGVSGDGVTFIGSDANELIIADTVSESTLHTIPENYNIVIALDVSSSMAYQYNLNGQLQTDDRALFEDENGNTSDRIAVAKAALVNLTRQLASYDGTVNLKIITFAADIMDEIVFENLSSSNMDALEAFINGCGLSKGTDYESAFNRAYGWFKSLPPNSGYVNSMYFVTDGAPSNYYKNTVTYNDNWTQVTVHIPEGVTD